MSLAAGIIGGIGAAGSIGSAALGSSAAGNAADAQAQASEYAANLQSQEAQQALQFQEGVYGENQQMAYPGYVSGLSGLMNLDNLLGITPPSANTTQIPQPWNPITQPGGPGTMSKPGSTGTSPTGIRTNPVSGGPSIGVNQPWMHSPVWGSNPPMRGGSSTTGFNGSPAPLWGGSPVTRNVGPNGQPISSPFSGNTNNMVGINGQPRSMDVPVGVGRGGDPSGPPGSSGGAPPTNPQTSSGTLGSLINSKLGATGSLMTPWTQQFQAPTLAQAEQYPGYQFQLEQGTQALDNSAAARGDLLSGNTLQATETLGQNLAQSDYQNVYNQALNQYDMSYNQFQQNQANQFNRLASLAGLQQTAVGQMGTAGQQAANNVSNTLLTSGQNIGQDIQNAGAATASGYVGSANAWGGALGNLGSLGQLLPLYQMLQQGNGAADSGAGGSSISNLL